MAALNLYARSPGTLTEDAALDLAGLLEQAAIVMANAQAYWGARVLSENLAAALTSRSTIDQAIGLLLSPGGRTPEEAYQMLVRASQRENRKLRDIAGELVQRSVLRMPPSS